MTRWNHFSDRIYKRILFKDLSVGDKFRVDLWKGKRRRADIICIKAGDLKYTELRSKKLHTLHFDNGHEVSSYDQKYKN